MDEITLCFFAKPIIFFWKRFHEKNVQNPKLYNYVQACEIAIKYEINVPYKIMEGFISYFCITENNCDCFLCYKISYKWLPFYA